VIGLDVVEASRILFVELDWKEWLVSDVEERDAIVGASVGNVWLRVLLLLVWLVVGVENVESDEEGAHTKILNKIACMSP